MGDIDWWLFLTRFTAAAPPLYSHAPPDNEYGPVNPISNTTTTNKTLPEIGSSGRVYFITVQFGSNLKIVPIFIIYLNALRRQITTAVVTNKASTPTTATR